MPEYIEREAIVQKIQDGLNNLDFGFEAIEVLELIYETPNADVVEVRHGEWVQIGYDEALDRITCSCCKEYFNLIDNCTEAFNYCPNCGAKMDGATDTNVGGKLTNLERIKSMSVNELSELLESTSNDLAIKFFGSYITRNKEHIQAWLESEVSE